MILQLNPSIPVETPKGNGQATLIVDYSPEHDFYWVVFIDDTRECWTFSNRDIRAQPNLTIGRGKFSPARNLTTGSSSTSHSFAEISREPREIHPAIGK